MEIKFYLLTILLILNSTFQIKIKHSHFNENPEDIKNLKKKITNNLSLEEKKSKFNLFKKIFRKIYTSNEDEKRFQIFSKNLDEISQHNQSNSSFKMGINKFSDLTQKEFSEIYLMKSNRE